MVATKFFKDVAASKVTAAALCLGIALSVGLTDAASAKSHKTSKNSSGASVLSDRAADEAALQGQLSTFGKLLAAGDAKSLAALWTVDGEYIDEDGNQTRGRGEIENRFALVFTQDGKPQVQLISDSVKFVAPTVALVEGVVQKTRDGQTATASRFSLVLVKNDGVWQMSRAAESPIVSTSSYDNLRVMDWLIGDWSAQNSAATVHMHAEWMPNKNFIVCKYDTKKANGANSVDLQVIGWDPLLEKPRSWHFDNSGGYGQGFWVKTGTQWVCDSAGVESDGSVTKSQNLMNISGANAFTWSSIHRSVNGMAVGDASALEVQRVIK